MSAILPHLIIGCGKTGQSCARYFERRGEPYLVRDSRALSPDDNVLLSALKQAKRPLILSPGISPATFPDHTVISDIELFAQHAKAPIIAITGTNAKGTVVTLVSLMIQNAGLTVLTGGNIGLPALDLLAQPTPDFYVLELSSFQLEMIYTLKTHISAILNISPDHLDRHQTLENYIAAKQRIYQDCDYAVFNHDDAATVPQANFSISKNKTHHINYRDLPNFPTLPPLKIKGLHNQQNAKAALAIGTVLNLSQERMLETLANFSGLEHRCEWVAEQNNITWYNDSKGTNIGATLAAINGFGSNQKNIILILGGMGKDQDFSLLQNAVSQYVRAIIVMGQDARLIANALDKSAPIFFADNLKAVIEKADALAQAQDIILFSPACASFDMFDNFEDRGEKFKAALTRFLGDKKIN